MISQTMLSVTNGKVQAWETSASGAYHEVVRYIEEKGLQAPGLYEPDNFLSFRHTDENGTQWFVWGSEPAVDFGNHEPGLTLTIDGEEV